MKKVTSILCALLLAAMLFTALPLTAAADTQSFTGIMGNEESFWFYQNYDDVVESASIDNGEVPGMTLSFPNPAAVALSGTPTQAGSYTLYVSVYTQQEGWLQFTLNVSIERPPEVKPTEAPEPTEAPKPTEAPEATEAPKEPKVPTVTKDPTSEWVVEGDSAKFIARADNVKKYAWEITIADAVLDCTQLPSYIGEDVTVSGSDTDTLVLSNIPEKLDGAHVRCRFIGEDDAVYSDYAKISVTPLEDAMPVVTKEPTNETIKEGGEAVFVAKAKYVLKYTWKLMSPDGEEFLCRDAGNIFEGLKVTGADTERLVLSNVPAELDAYRVYCEFTAGKTVVGGKARIYVTTDPTEATTEATTEPKPTETEPTEAPTKATTAPTEETEPVQTTTPEATEVEKNMAPQKDGTGLLITIIISLTMITVAVIGAVVFLKMKGKL